MNGYSARWRFRLGLLLATIGSVACGTVLGCDSLSVVTVNSRLEFGNLRMPDGASGWLAVDPRGGVASGGAVNFASGKRPAPAEIELQGVPGKRYLLQLSHDSESGSERAAAVLGRLLVAVDGQPLAEGGDTFEVSLPRTAPGARSVIRLMIGGELQIRRFSSPLVVHAGIRLRCLASRSQ